MGFQLSQGEDGGEEGLKFKMDGELNADNLKVSARAQDVTVRRVYGLWLAAQAWALLAG